MDKNTTNPNKTVCLFRKNHTNKTEYLTASLLLPTFTQRCALPENSIVIGRYSVLPYYHEVIEDLAVRHCTLVNDLYQHEYIANMDYYYDITEHTFPTWFRLEDVPFSLRDNTAFVVKGKTNSKKQQWNTKMYAPSFKQAVELSTELLQDSLISSQGIVVRKYIPLETFEIGINEMPMTNEWRIFFYKNKMLAYGFYWEEILDDINKHLIQQAHPSFIQEGLPFAKQIAEIIAENTNFFVIDVAKTQSGKWIVVEVNDGQMSGLNSINATYLYSSLVNALK